MRFNKVILVLGLLLVALACILFLFREPLLFAIGNYLIIEDDLSPADVIHVIAGEDYRTDYAIWLYQQGYAGQIFFTGGWCEFHHYFHGQHGLERALSQGVPQQAIAFDDTPVTSTYDEALRLKAYLDASPSPIRSVIVVSDPFHMRRARWTYRRVLGEAVEVRMAPVPFEQTPYQERWWKNYLSTVYVMEEYKKVVYYIARYKLNLEPLNSWLASLDRE